MRIGAHLPTRGGLRSTIDAARACDAAVAQVFVSNPRRWAPPRISDVEAAEFRVAWEEAGIGPLFVHAPYLVNIASSNPSFLRRGRDLARRSLATAASLGAAGFVVHAGSGGDAVPEVALELAAGSLGAIVSEGETPVLVELTAGTRGSVAATFPEAVRLFAAAGEQRLGLCIDSCHLFAAGYGLDAEGVGGCFGELEASGLRDRLKLVHANDARDPRGSRRDRHAKIGEGHIGVSGFAEILRRREVSDVPFVLETPGDLGDHARGIATLRSLAPEGGPR